MIKIKNTGSPAARIKPQAPVTHRSVKLRTLIAVSEVRLGKTRLLHSKNQLTFVRLRVKIVYQVKMIKFPEITPPILI